YGCNWDAFWDCLTDMVGRPVHIEIIGLNVIEQKFGDEAKTMVDILKEFKHYRNDKYAKDIKIEFVMGERRFEL
ncbi:MAG: barstar family protein, partial [Clostridia bacterium]|nr:barstar family protein [Clostridia bacterium]